MARLYARSVMLAAEVAAALSFTVAQGVESATSEGDALVLSQNAGSDVATGVHGELSAGRPVRDPGGSFSFYV